MKNLIYFLSMFVIILSCTENNDQEELNNFTGDSGIFIDDRDGHEYKWIKIGEQIWMAENLAYLPGINRSTQISETLPRYYVYGYGTNSKIYIDVSAAKTTSNYKIYGVLYNWQAAIPACPDGWHVPTDAEWEELATYFGGFVFAGGKMKEAGTTHWKEPNEGATNESGFSGLPGGFLRHNGNFNFVGNTGYWWSATEPSALTAWYRDLKYDSPQVDRNNHGKEGGFSVRCVRD